MTVAPQHILDALEDGLVVYDEQFVCTQANEAAIARLGRDPRGRDVREILDGIPPAALASRTPVDLPDAALSKGGESSDIALRPVPGGTVVHCRAGSSASREEHERLAVTLDSIGDGVIVTDHEARVTRMNRVAIDETGWALEDARGRHISEVLELQDELQRHVRRPVEDVIESRKATALHDHTLLVARDGGLFPLAYNAAPILMPPDGRLAGVVLVFRDMRARRRLEEELIRGAKLSAVGDLAGYIAHDFNNVLGAIVGSTSLGMRYTRPGERMHDLLVVTEAACRRGQELAQELLTFARGGAPLKEPVDLAPLARRAAEISGRHDGSARFRLDIAPDLAQVRGDAGQLRQVLQNLLRNADEASGPGAEVSLRLANTRLPRGTSIPLPEGPYVQIEVQDRGEGIPDDRLSSIFDPFYTTRPRSVGLGLATVHSIVSAHAGFLTVESTVGEGTTFTLFLPAMNEELRPEASAPAGAPRTVLVMDDDPLVRTTLQKLLEELGYSVTSTADGDEAVFAYGEALREGQPFALAVLDLKVPGGKGGVETLREILVMDATVRAIATSGYFADPVLANFRDHGFAGTLPKPFTFDTLRRRLDEVLGEPRDGPGPLTR